MSGISGVMNIAKGALIAQQKAMEVTSHNLANVNTPGYTRQRVIFEPEAPLSSNRIKIGMGVKIDSVIQEADQLTTRSILEKLSVLNDYESKKATLSYLETIFNEATDQGLSQAMNEFWNAWQDLANNPGGIPERTALLEKAEMLAKHFNSMSSSLSHVGKDMNTRLSDSLGEMNTLTREIAELNDRIVASEAVGTAANDLRDQRNNLVEKLSGLIGINVLENSQGALTVMTLDGTPLVDGNQSWAMNMEEDRIYWNGIQTDLGKKLAGGKIGAWLDLRDEVVPQFLANLDELAGTFIEQVNVLHRAGYTLTGETGKNFFEDFKVPPETPNAGDYAGAAGFIRLSGDVERRADQIAAGGLSGAPGDNENAMRIVSMQGDDSIQIRKWDYKERGGTISNQLETETLDDYYQSLVSEVGMVTEEATQNYDFTQTLLDQMSELRDSTSGVNLDEEMTELIKLQRSYEAAAKLISVADEMLQSLLQMR